jgi:hypothetical protein
VVTPQLLQAIVRGDDPVLETPCYARAPFEFLAGAVLNLDDEQMQQILLPEVPVFAG